MVGRSVIGALLGCGAAWRLTGPSPTRAAVRQPAADSGTAAPAPRRGCRSGRGNAGSGGLPRLRVLARVELDLLLRARHALLELEGPFALGVQLHAHQQR